MIVFEEYKKRVGTDVNEEIFEILNNGDRYGEIFESYYGSILFHPILVGISKAILERSVKDNDSEIKSRISAYKLLAGKFAKIIRKYKNKNISINRRYEQMKPTREEQLLFSEYAGRRIIDNIEKQLDVYHDFYEAVNTDLGQELSNLLFNERKVVFQELYDNKNTNGVCVYLDIIEAIKRLWKLKIKSYEDAVTNLRLEIINIKNRRK